MGPETDKFKYLNTKLVQYDGGVDKSGRKYKPIWDGIISKCKQGNVDPLEMALFVFKTTIPSEIPDPRTVCDPQMMTRYHSTLQKEYDAVGPMLLTDKASFAAALRKYSFRTADPAVVYAMALSDRNISPLFRFVACLESQKLPTEMRDKLLLRLSGDAITQFSSKPGVYMKSWSELLNTEVINTLKEISKIALKEREEHEY